MNWHKSRLLIVLAALLTVAAFGSNAHAAQSTPDAKKPARIVSVTLGTDEILFGLLIKPEERARIAAITENAVDPGQSNIVEDAKAFKDAKKTIVKADPEVILSYKPDLVLVASYTDAGVVKQIKDAGVTVLAVEKLDTIKDIQDNILTIGKAIGADANAQILVQDMDKALKSVEDAVATVKEKKSVIFYGYDGYSWGKGTLVDELITRAGGLNLVNDPAFKDAYPKLSDEFVVKADPDFIIISPFSPDISKNAAFATLKAVKDKKVIAGNDAHLSAVSQYVVLGVQDLAALFYPDLVKLPATPIATAVATVAATVAVPAK
jgi:iron complex transport system substrate-binding protein